MTDEPSHADLTRYDDSSSAGYICKECGALVPRKRSFTRLHTDWHRRLDDMVTRGQQDERELKGLSRRGG
jgi:hypothetical protein